MESTKGRSKAGFFAMATQTTTKERILEAVRNLPADATADDVIETIVFIAKVEEGLARRETRVCTPSWY